MGNREAEKQSADARNVAPSSSMWRFYPDLPPVGSRIICIYEDASGAVLFYVSEAGLIDADGDEWGDYCDSGFSMWAMLPDGFRLWCELRAEDPMIFTASSAGASASAKNEATA